MIHRSYRLSAFLLASSVLALAPHPVRAQQADLAASVPHVVHFGTWGVDISTRDLSVRPGDDFQRYASGKWMDTHEIPADKSQNGIGSELADRNQEQLRAIVLYRLKV
jgi:putative endopeptidase